MTESEYLACLNDPELPIPEDTRTVIQGPRPSMVSFYTTPAMVIRWYRGEYGPRPLGDPPPFENGPLENPDFLYLPAYLYGKKSNPSVKITGWEPRCRASLPVCETPYDLLDNSDRVTTTNVAYSHLRWNWLVRSANREPGFLDLIDDSLAYGFERMNRLFENLGVPEAAKFFNSVAEEVFQQKSKAHLDFSKNKEYQLFNLSETPYVDLTMPYFLSYSHGEARHAPVKEIPRYEGPFDWEEHREMWKTWMATTHPHVLLIPNFRKRLALWLQSPKETRQLFYVPIEELSC